MSFHAECSECGKEAAYFRGDTKDSGDRPLFKVGRVYGSLGGGMLPEELWDG